MDYIYGKLNSEVEKIFYNGLNTETTNIVVDNTEQTIKVDVLKTQGILSIKNLEDNSLSLFNGAGDLEIELPKVSDKVFQTEFDEFRDYTNNKFAFVETDYNEKIIAEKERAEENESAIRTALSEESERAIAEENKKVNIDSPYKYNIDTQQLTNTYVYTVVPNEGEPKLIKVVNTKSAEGLSIAQRTNEGNLCINETPRYDYHAASKKYVDDEISGLFNSTELKLTEKADLVSGIVPVNQLPVVTETESGLITADNNNYLVYLKSVIDKESGTLSVTGPSVLHGPVTLPTANPLTVFGETHLKNTLFVEGQTTITGKSIDDNPVNTFTISNFLSGEISVKNNLNMLPCGSVYVPSFDLPQLTSYTEDSYPGTGDWEAVNKTVLLQFNNHVNAKIRDAISTVEPVKDTANQALNEARNAQAEIDALEESTSNMYGSTNQANIQRLYNDERPTNPEVGQIFCLLISDASFGVVGTQKYLQWDGTEWVELVNKKYVDSYTPKTITISNSFRYGEDIDGSNIELTKDEYNSIVTTPELISLKLTSESGDESRIAHYSGKHFGNHSWLISDAYSGNFYNVEVYTSMEETMKYRMLITKVIIGTQVTLDESTGTLSID